MANFMQIIDVSNTGTETVYHPETDADFVIPGKTYKVPTILEITDWINRSKELAEARKGKATLKLKIDEIDNMLLAKNLLAAIKSVDGSGSGLDADMVDGRTVDDANDSDTVLWTAAKIASELNKKVNNSLITSEASPNKILKLDVNGNLPTNITKNAATSTRLEKALTLKFGGDVSGSVTFSGDEVNKNIDLQVSNNSHSHNNIESGSVATIKTTGNQNIVEFKVGNLVKSYVDGQGNFSGSANKVGGFSVNNSLSSSLWTGEKIKIEATAIAKKESLQVVENELMLYASKNELGLSLGPANFMTGEVEISGNNTIDISIPKAIEKVLIESFVIESTDAGLTFVKSPNSTNNLITLRFNKIPVSGSKLKWYITAI